MARPPIRIVGAALRGERRRRHARWMLGSLCTLLIAALGASAAMPPRPRLLWNASASAPVGLWRVLPDARAGRGDMVVVRLGEPWRGLAARRRYLPANVPLIKRVAAMPGDRICAFEAWVFVEGRLVATRRRADVAGRPLSWWHGCRTLRDGAMLLLMDDPLSFDGRYFGPTGRHAIVGKALPLWVR